MRWEPQQTIGTSGTPAWRAMRTAPFLKLFSSNEREMVASGKMPTMRPRSSSRTASPPEAAPAERSTLTWSIIRMTRPTTGMSKTSRLAMKRTNRLPRMWGGTCMNAKS